MKLFLDTNIFLEVILEQEKAMEAKALLGEADEHELFMSDYSLHSIGLLLFRRKQHDVFMRFLVDLIHNAGVRITRLSPRDMEAVVSAAHTFKLDFDDAYQYASASK